MALAAGLPCPPSPTHGGIREQMLLPQPSSAWQNYNQAKLGWMAGQVLPSSRAASGLCPPWTASTPHSTSRTLPMRLPSPTAC